MVVGVSAHRQVGLLKDAMLRQLVGRPDGREKKELGAAVRAACDNHFFLGVVEPPISCLGAGGNLDVSGLRRNDGSLNKLIRHEGDVVVVA